jgi:hypothetical protein
VFSTVATSGNFADLLSKPTTLTGYGITDAMSTSHPANGITSANISNWSTAYGWGNHAGLYRPIGYVPSWNEITGKPTFAAVATSGSYTDLIDKPTILGSQWNTSGSNIYYNSGNVGIGTSSPATYIHAHGAPITSRGQLSLSSPAGQDVFLSLYEADIFKAYLWYNVSDQDLRLQNFTAGDLSLNPYGGKVGIGTLDPTTTLDVSGIITATGGTFSDDLIIHGLTVGLGGNAESTNTSIGVNALSANTTGSGANTAVGYQALYSNTTGYLNTSNGYQALYSNKTGRGNTANGYLALWYNLSGNYNTAYGQQALQMNQTGNNNTAIGTAALASNSSGYDNTAIGCQADVINGSYNNATAIGYNAKVDYSNKVRIGNTSVTVIEGQVGFSYPSDMRLKKNIKDLSSGLDFILKLRPVEYQMKQGDDKTNFGFIAQDIETLVGTNNSLLTISADTDRTLGLRYTDFIAPIVKAIQELSKQNNEMKKEIEQLKAANEVLKQH